MHILTIGCRDLRSNTAIHKAQCTYHDNNSNSYPEKNAGNQLRSSDPSPNNPNFVIVRLFFYYHIKNQRKVVSKSRIFLGF